MSMNFDVAWYHLIWLIPVVWAWIIIYELGSLVADGVSYGIRKVREMRVPFRNRQG